MAKIQPTILPIRSFIVWQEGVNEKKYAVELAKGFITSRFTAVEASWYAVAPFMGGYFYEVHEGGAGKGYLDSALEALNNDPTGQYWFPCGDRAFQVMMRDGKPFGILLSARDSLEVFNSGKTPLMPKTKMLRAVRKGTATMVTGLTMLSSSALFLITSLGFYFIAGNPGPSVPMKDISNLPHSQWAKVVNTGVEEIVSKLELNGDRWDVVKRVHIVPGLNELKQEGQRELNRIKSEIAPMPVDPLLSQPILEEPMAEEANSEPEAMEPNSEEIAPNTETLEAPAGALEPEQLVDPLTGEIISSSETPQVEQSNENILEGPALSIEEIRERVRNARSASGSQTDNDNEEGDPR